MNIYSKRGEKVFFTGTGGHPHQLEKAKKIFSVGQELTVDDIDVHSFSSSVKFQEHDEWFNTVMFENTETLVMNKQIDELRLDAGISRLDDNFRLIVINEQGEVIDPLIGLEKFARLIIQDCCQALQPMLRDQISREQGADLIKKHFGV
jgi:hypothetical protein